MQVNTRYIHSTKGTSGGGYVLCIYKGCTSGGVYVHCIYSHARWGLSQATPVFVVALVWHHPSTNFNSLVCLTILHGYSGHCSISNCNHISTQIVSFLGHWTFYRNRLAEDLRKLFTCIIYLKPLDRIGLGVGDMERACTQMFQCTVYGLSYNYPITTWN